MRGKGEMLQLERMGGGEWGKGGGMPAFMEERHKTYTNIM